MVWLFYVANVIEIYLGPISDTNMKQQQFIFAILNDKQQSIMHTRYIRVLRAMYADHGRPILLEGVPGVGKSELVAALARQTNHGFVRINLSEQTVWVLNVLFYYICLL